MLAWHDQTAIRQHHISELNDSLTIWSPRGGVSALKQHRIGCKDRCAGSLELIVSAISMLMPLIRFIPKRKHAGGVEKHYAQG